MGTFEVFSSYFISSFLHVEKEYDFLVLEMTPGKIEQSILAGIIDVGITYIPSPDPLLEYVEIGTFGMGIFGRKSWEDKAFEECPFAIPTTEFRIHSSEIDSLDMWPRSAPKRYVKYQYKFLETALQTSLQLISLTQPPSYKGSKPSKVYLVGRKGGRLDCTLERKLAKFMRLLI